MRTTKLYAQALYELQTKETYLAFYNELQAVTQLFEALAPEIWRFNNEPKQFDVIKETLNDAVSPLMSNFLQILVHDGLLHRIDTITRDYLEVLIDRDVIDQVTITTAEPLSDSLYERLQQLIARHWGEETYIQTVVDPALISGIKLTSRDEHYDTSIGSRLTKMKEELQRDTN